MNKENAIYNELWTIAPFFKWMDRHPTLSNIILWIEAIVAFLAVYTYDFTTNF